MSDHGEMSHDGVLTDLGKMGNWEALVDDRRQELVLWMRNNLAELTGQQFIDSIGGGVQFEVCWLPERGKVTGVSAIVAFTVARPPAMDELTAMVHCDVLKLLGTWRTVGKRPTPTRVISAGRRPSDYAGPSLSGAKIFTPP
jgi:hypothetical protein